MLIASYSTRARVERSDRGEAEGNMIKIYLLMGLISTIAAMSHFKLGHKASEPNA